MDDLSKSLNLAHIGYMLGSAKINHLMYADDLVILSPSAKGLRKLLKICEVYGIEFDIKYNGNKSSVLLFTCSKLKDCDKCIFKLNDEIISIGHLYKYLGHIM